MKFILRLLIILSLSPLIFPQNNTEIKNSLDIKAAYYFPNHEGYSTSNNFAPIDYSKMEFGPQTNDPGRTIGSTWGGAENEFVFNHDIKTSFLVGNSIFTKNNYISSKSSLHISFVHTELTEQISFSPLAFLVISGGTGVSLGWKTLSFNGLGRNLPGENYDSSQDESLKGFVYKYWGENLIQFDLAEIWPGEWNHVVFVVKSKIEYKEYSKANTNEAWQWKNDSGDNFNGTKFFGTYLIGYKMPSKIDFIGFLAETEEYIDNNRNKSPLKDAGWGSDLTELKFGPLLRFKINDKSHFTSLIQFRRFPKYTKETIGNRYFAYRESTGETYYSLYRIALIYHYDF